MDQSTSKQKGLAAIEFTLILPFFFMLIFVTAEFGRMFYQYNALNKSVRDGARYLSRFARPNDSDVLQITEMLETQAKNLVFYGDIVTSEGTALLPNLNIANVEITTADPFITMKVEYDWKTIFHSDTNSLEMFGISDNLDLNFKLVASYTVAAL